MLSSVLLPLVLAYRNVSLDEILLNITPGFCFVRKCACKGLLLSWFYQAPLPELLQSSQRPFAVQWLYQSVPRGL